MGFFYFGIITRDMKKTSVGNLERRFYSTLAVGVALSLIIIGLLFYVQSLSMQVATLQNQVTTTSAQLKTYGRTLCSTAYSAPVAVRSKHGIESAGYARTYQVHTPNNYDPSVRYPVIVSFDGVEGSGARMEAYSGLDELPAVVVYPDSLPGKSKFTAWEGAPYSVDGDRDVQFVSDILETIPSQYCIDSTRIYAVGMSNGGAFATTVGCKLGDQIKAVASVSGAYYTACASEQHTPSLLVVHSTDDRQAPFKGVAARRLPPVPQYVENQVVARHCKTPSEITTSYSATYSTWTECDDNSSVQLIVLRKQAHGWLALPQVSLQQVEGSAGYIWNFFEEATFRN
jgi:polyhydroxybutyrate depolymerase